MRCPVSIVRRGPPASGGGGLGQEREFELPGREAIISRDGERLIIEPVRKKGLAALLDSWEPLDEDFPEIDDPLPAPRII